MGVSSHTIGYTLCSECGKARTKDPSGVCSRCRAKIEGRRARCRICGVRGTSHPSGVCAQCRRARTADTLDRMGPQIKSEYIDNLIKNLWEDIALLNHYQDGKSFEEIAEIMNRSKTSVYQTFRRLVGTQLFEMVPQKESSAYEEDAE